MLGVQVCVYGRFLESREGYKSSRFFVDRRSSAAAVDWANRAKFWDSDSDSAFPGDHGCNNDATIKLAEL